MSRIRYRRHANLISAAIGGLIVLLLCIVGGYFLYQNMTGNHLTRQEQLEREMLALKEELRVEREDNVMSWVLKEDIEAGTAIHPDMLMAVSIPIAVKPEDLVTRQEAAGKFTKIAIKKNTPIVSSMLFEEGITPDDQRMAEYHVIQLPLDLEVDDFVDIRIAFPTGHDFIVQTKKKISKLNSGMVLYHINEEELLLMQSAIVDAYINDAKIYAIKYTDPYIQQAAIVNYTPNEYVIDLIQHDPNILNVATNYLEKKVRNELEKSLESVSSEDRAQFSTEAQRSSMIHSVPPSTTVEETETKTEIIPPPINMETSDGHVFHDLP